jgi:transposase
MTDEQSVVRNSRRTPAEIEQIVSEFEASGLNRTQFCRRRGLTLGTLGRYQKRLRVGSSQGASGAALVAVELAQRNAGAEPAAGWGLAVVLASGRRIAVGVGFDATTLQRLVQVLETM